LTLIANGVIRVPDGELTDDDAWDIAMMFVMLGRAVPPKRWVDTMVDQARVDSMKCLM